MPFKDKETQKAYQREYQRYLRAGSHWSARQSSLRKNKTRKTWTPTKYRIERTHDLLKVLEDAMNAVSEDEVSTPLQKARALGYLVGIGIRVVETANLENRVDALERLLNTRSDASSCQGGVCV